MKNKFTYVLFVSITVVSATAVLTTNNPLNRRAEPAYISFKGEIGENMPHVNLRGLNTSGRRFSGKSNSGKDDVLLPINSTRNADDLLSIASGAITAREKSLSGSTTYTYRHTERKNNTSGVAGFSGNEALGLLAQKGTGSDDEKTGISGVPPVLAQTTYDQPMPSDRYLAPTVNKGKPGGGHPGLNPDVPVGDGVLILLILCAGYILYRRKISGQVQL